MKKFSGLGKLDRERLAALLRGTKHTISVKEAAKILGMSKTQAAKLLSRWSSKGWLSRIKQGLYAPISIESITPDVPLEDPWVIAEKIYHPCYIGGWSAAEHWGLTEQIFRTIIVITPQKVRKHNPIIKGTHFLVRTTSKQNMFGLQSVWRGQIKVFVSDPTRTIIDLLIDPKLAGGIRSTTDMLSNYLKSEYKNLKLLTEYAKRIKNGTVFKRLGFLLELYAPDELEIIAVCKAHLTAGNVKLDPVLAADRLITRWRLWVPKDWKV